jgi:shikimate kinase
VVLVGIMGSGKSAIGIATARALGWPFIDLDDEIEARADKAIADLFSDEGEKSFRRREREALAEMVTTAEPSVLATGGGAVLDPQNRETMRANALVVWLRAHPREVHRRLSAEEVAARPLLHGAVDEPGGVEGRLTAMLDERAHAYEAAAHTVIEVDDRRVDDIAAEVAGLVGTEAP